MNITNPERVCPECGQTFTATHGRQRFCMTGTKPGARRALHADNFRTRQARRGKVAVSLLQTWRWRNVETDAELMAFAYKELCALAGVYNREDKEAGRKPFLTVAERKDGDWRAVDLI